ncbi:MAG TPA: arsenate reductase ArsC [Thermoplasmata archaeon]
MIEPGSRERVLFVCTHNSARSQMAEGLLRQLYGDRFEAHSAGTKPTAVDPRAVRAMAEIKIDISQQRSKSVNEFDGKDIDQVVTLCNDAKEGCPFFPGAKRYIHRGFVDPVQESEPGDPLASFRRVRDDLKDWISETFSPQKKEGANRGMGFELSQA